MGCPIVARSQAGDLMPCTRASTPSRNPFDEDFKSLPVGSKGIAAEERDSVLQAFSLHGREKSSRREAFSKGQFGHPKSEGRQSSISIPPYQALAPCSPSESNTSSSISKLGSSSSSSSSSSSLFNETRSPAVEEFSPASVTSSEVKQAECSPARKSFKRISLAPKLAAVAPLGKWDDIEMHVKCSLPKPAQIPSVKAETLNTLSLEQGAKARRQRGSKGRKDNLGSNSSHYLDCDEGFRDAGTTNDYLGHGRSAEHLHFALKPLADEEPRDGASISAFFTATANSALSHRKCSNISDHAIDGFNPAFAGIKYIPSNAREGSYRPKCDYLTAHYKDVECEMHKDGQSERCNAGSRLRKGRSRAYDSKGVSHLEGHGSFDLLPHVKSDTQMIPMCVTEGTLTPYEADIGVDAVSLQPRVASLSPCEKTKLQQRVASLSPCEKAKLPRASSAHQPIHANEKVLSFQPPVTPPKLNLDARCSTRLHLFDRDMPFKTPTEQCTSGDKMFGERKEAPIGFSGRRPAATQVRNRSRPIMHSQDDMQKAAKACLLPPVTKACPHNEIFKPSLVSSSDGNFTEKADVFTMHSPLLPKELKSTEVCGASTLNPPVPFASKVQWDWRSKSMGAKASLKSAVRNLEATFSGSRSVSLPKTRTQAQKELKPGSARLLDRVFVSPLRTRSKQVGILKATERPLYPSRQSNEVQDSGFFRRRDAKTSIPCIQSYHARAHVPAGSVVRPLPPIGYRDVEVTCKPFIPASRSMHCLPAPRGSLGVQGSVSSGQKSDGLQSHAFDAASPCMLHAHLQCTLKDGLPCYTMTVEGSEEMLLARACWLENHSSREACKLQYSFHLGQIKARGTGSSGWRSWIKKESKTASDLIGFMQVSSISRHEVVLATGELQLFKESEFVLYDGRGTGVAHSQSLRFSPMDKPCDNSSMLGSSRESPSSLSHPLSEPFVLFSPTHSEMATKKHHVRSLTDLDMSSESASTAKSASSLHKGTGGHRPSLSLDVWSDSDVPGSVQPLSSPCSSSCIELAAMVIRVSVEGHQRDSNVSDGDHNRKNSKGWGLKFLDDGIESGVSHTLPQRSVEAEKAMKFESNGWGQAGFGTSWPYAELKPYSAGNRLDTECMRVNGDGLPTESWKANQLSTIEELQDTSLAEKFARQGSSGSVTLLLPTGDHGFPNGTTRGPSSLIERWRSGGSCECGGWDLGCGIKVIGTGSSNKCMASNEYPNASVSNDQQCSLFSQGRRQELMLRLFPVKQGEYKLSFQGQISPLKAFATAVAMLHSQQLPLLPPSPVSSAFVPLSSSLMSSASSKLLLSSMSTSSSSSSLKLLSSPSLSSSSPPIDAGTMIHNHKKRPPRPPQNHLVASRRSDASSKEISLLLVHNKIFSY